MSECWVPTLEKDEQVAGFSRVCNQERFFVEQLRLQLWEAYCQVRYLCSHLRGNDSADSAVSTDSSMDESSETSSAKDVPAGSLRMALSELKRLIQSIVDGMEPTVSGQTEKLLTPHELAGGRLKASTGDEVKPRRGTLQSLREGRLSPYCPRALYTGDRPEGQSVREWKFQSHLPEDTGIQVESFLHVVKSRPRWPRSQGLP